MAAENHSPPARSLRRTQCTNLWVVYNCALSKLRGFRLLPFQQFFQYILRVLPVKNEFQQQHYIIVRQAFRLLQKTFQHTATGTEPVRCALPGASCGKRMISSTLATASNHHRGRYASPALAAPATPLWTCRPETSYFSS